MAYNKQPRYDSSPSPRARPYSSGAGINGVNGTAWGTKARTASGPSWMKKIVDDEDDEGSELDVENVTRDIGKMRRESEENGNGWESEFTAMSMEISTSPRLQTKSIPTRIEEIMDDERSIAVDDDDEQEEEEEEEVEEWNANGLSVVGEVVKRLAQSNGNSEGEYDNYDGWKSTPTSKEPEVKKDSIRARSMERRTALRQEWKERREQRKPITSYESEDNKAPHERQKGELRQRLHQERRSQSDDLSKNEPFTRGLRDDKENGRPLNDTQEPVSRLEKRYQREDGLGSIKRARDNRIRNEHNLRVQERERARLRQLEKSEINEYTEEPRYDKTILEEEGERIQGTPITIFSGHERMANGSSSRQQDSLSILRNLSKAITGNHVNGNNSPDPAKSDTNPDIEPEPRKAPERASFELQNRPEEAMEVPTPPPTRIDPLLLPTPRVTGAFIDTPAPPRVSSNSRLASKEESDRPAIKRESTSHSEPPSSKTSTDTARPINGVPIASALEDLRRIEKEAHIDDTTLDRDISLILKTQADPTSKPDPSPTLPELIPNLEHLSPKERERKLEELAFDRMSQSLRYTTSSIRDARHGIERLEQQVSHAQQQQGNLSPQELGIPTPTSTTSKLGPTFIPSTTHPSTIHYLAIPIPRLRNPITKKLTLLGLLLSIFITWFIIETIMCAQYCKPVVAAEDVWDPSDPYWPWAIPTMIDRWTGKVASTAWEGLEDWWNPGEEIVLWRDRVARGEVRDDRWWGVREEAMIGEDDDVVLVEVVDASAGAGERGSANGNAQRSGGWRWGDWGNSGWDADEVIG